jgi:hypothetical protein
MRRGIASLICFFAHCESSVDWRRLTGRHPAPHLIKNDDSCKAHFGGLFLWAKKPAWFHAGKAVTFRFCPGICFLSGSRKILSRIHFVNNGFKHKAMHLHGFFICATRASFTLCFVVNPSGGHPKGLSAEFFFQRLHFLQYLI